MKKLFRYIVLFAAFVLGLYLILTLFLVFALLAFVSLLAWLYIRFFGKSSNVDASTNGVTIDHEPATKPEAIASVITVDVQTTEFEQTYSEITVDELDKEESPAKSANDLQEIVGEAKSPDITQNDVIIMSKDPIQYGSSDERLHLWKNEAKEYCQSPNTNASEIIGGLVKLTEDIEENQSVRASAFRLLGEVHEANGELMIALEHYKTALSIDEKVGVKRKISQLEKSIGD